MPRMTATQYALHQAKQSPVQPALIPTSEEMESELHEQIISWTRRQDPQVPYIHARMDKKSTITPGACDFTLFLSQGRLLLVECKTADGDLSDDQKVFF